MVVGEARVIVRAITTGVRRDIQRAFDGVDDIGVNAGRNIGRGLNRGFSGGGGGRGMFDNLATAAEGARAQFDSLIRTAYTLGPVVGQLAGAIGALVGGFSALALTVAGALPSLLALPGALVSIATAATTLKLAFSGVGDAISAGVRAAGASGGGASGAARDLTNLYRRIEDAKTRLVRVINDNVDRIREANKKLEDAEQDYLDTVSESSRLIKEAKKDLADTIEDSYEDIAEAQRNLQEVEERSSSEIAKAKRRVEKAQLELNAAFEAGREEIQQLNFAAEDAVIAEKRAALELEKAREQLLRVQDLPPNDRARREAELAFAQADLNYRKAMDTNADTAKEKARLDKEGIEGTAEVSRARERLADAEESRAETEIKGIRDIEDARRNLIKVQEESIESIRDAEEEYGKLIEDRARAEKEAAEDRQQAALDYNKVSQENYRREYDATLALNRAFEDLEKAKKQGNAGGAGAANAYKKALAGLSKEQRQFVQYMVGTFIPAIDDLRDAAARKFFPQLIPAMEDLRTRLFPALIPLLEKTGGVLGKIAKDFTETLTSDESIRQIEKIWDASDNTLAGLGEVATNALSGVLNVLEASLPLVERFVGWLVDLSEDFKGLLDTEGERNAFTEFLEKSGNISATLGDIFGDVFGGLGNLISEQVEPGSGGWMMLDFFRQAAANFREFTEVNPERINEFFQNTASNSQSILGFLKEFVATILRLGENPNVGIFFDKLKELTPTLEGIGNKLIDAGPALADFLRSFLEFADATLDSGAIQTFWEVLTGIFDALTRVFRNPAMQQGLIVIGGLAAAGVALRTAWMLLRIPILGILEPVTGLIKGFKKLDGKFGESSGILGKLLRGFKAFGGLGTGPIALIIAAVAGLIAIFVAMWNESEIFRESLKKLWDTVVNKVLSVFEDLRKKVDEALEPLGGMEGVVDGLKVAFKALGDFVGTYIVPLFEVGLSNAIDVIGAVLGTAIDLVGGLIETITNVVSKIQEGDIGGAFRELLYGIFIRPFDTILENIIGLLTNIINNIKSFITDNLGGTLAGDILTGFYDGFLGLLQIVQDVWNNVLNWIKTFLGIASPSKVFEEIGNSIVDGVETALQVLFDILTAPFRVAWENIKSTVETVVNWFRDTAGPTITNVIDRLKTGFNNAKTSISTAWNGIKTAIETVANFLKNVISVSISTFFNGLKTGADTLKTNVTTAFNNIKSVVETVAGAVKRALSGLWSGLSAGLSAAVSSVRRLLRPAFNFIVGVANEMRKIPGVGSLIPNLTMPAWLAAGAEGAIVTRPTLALIGEAGPEALIPLHKMPGSSPIPNNLGQTESASRSTEVNINVYASPGMDEIEIANIVSREISFMMRKGSV